MARRIEELRPRRRATEGLSSLPTTSSVWIICDTPRSLRIRSIIGRNWGSRPKKRNSAWGYRRSARLAPRTTAGGAWSPPIASRARMSRALTTLVLTNHFRAHLAARISNRSSAPESAGPGTSLTSGRCDAAGEARRCPGLRYRQVHEEHHEPDAYSAATWIPFSLEQPSFLSL